MQKNRVSTSVPLPQLSVKQKGTIGGWKKQTRHERSSDGDLWELRAATWSVIFISMLANNSGSSQKGKKERRRKNYNLQKERKMLWHFPPFTTIDRVWVCSAHRRCGSRSACHSGGQRQTANMFTEQLQVTSWGKSFVCKISVCKFGLSRFQILSSMTELTLINKSSNKMYKVCDKLFNVHDWLVVSLTSRNCLQRAKHQTFSLQIIILMIIKITIQS